MKPKVDKTNKNIYNLFLQNFLAPLPKYYSNAQEKIYLNFQQFLRMAELKNIL